MVQVSEAENTAGNPLSAGGGHRLYFSTDTSVCGKDVYDIYRTRFQIEFCFRDGHQFTRLPDCQARDEKVLDFAYNASLAAVNITKVLRKQTKMPFFYWSN